MLLHSPDPMLFIANKLRYFTANRHGCWEHPRKDTACSAKLQKRHIQATQNIWKANTKDSKIFCSKDPSPHLRGIIISSFNLNSLETADTELVYRSWRAKLCISPPSLSPSPAVLTSAIFLHCAKDLPTLSAKYCLFRLLPPLFLFFQVL